MSQNPLRFFRSLLWVLICVLFLPALMATGAVPPDKNATNAHVLRRLNSPERAAAIEKMKEEANARGDGGGMLPPSPPLALPSSPLHHGGNGQSAAVGHPSKKESWRERTPAGETRKDGVLSDSSAHPRPVTEMLFHYGASFMGVPGLAPQRGTDGSLDEGLGFHQNGTGRKAGGVAGSSGPSANGQRARFYMRSGLSNDYGIHSYGAAYSGFGSFDSQYPLGPGRWRGDSTRGGRVSSSSGYSRELGDFDPMSMVIDRGLKYGAGFVNSMGEAALSGLVDGGRARLNFRLDKDGYFNGEGDALLPFYDSARTTIYTQIGARSMHDSDDTRWIGNFGLGQRWFPFATGDYGRGFHVAKDGGSPAGEREANRRDALPPSVSERDSESPAGRGGEHHPYDAGKLMLGYNAFFDYDFTRDHQRGGIGAEVWYDWLRLSSNYYFPLSGWKGSEDFDSRFVKERAAKGWDARVKAYLPFYWHIALTGAYSQWYGDHVGVFGADNLEKNPRVWSYGIEYTPVPLVSGFIMQKSTERGRSDTEFGLTFTYHFQMPWEDQIAPAKVAELRTIGGSRHEFVDRENKIILEYKAKNAYHIEYLRFSNGQHLFRVRDGFGKTASGRTVAVTSLSGAVLLGGVSSLSISTNEDGVFGIGLATDAPDPTTVTVQAGANSQTFTLAGGGGVSAGGLTLAVTYNRTSFVTSDYSATATITATATDAHGNSVTIGPADVAWTVESSSITAPWWNNRSSGAMNGLTWGLTPLSLNADESELSGVSGTASTGDTATLTDIVGLRTVTVKAVMNINGTAHSETVTVIFGPGPLSVFADAPTPSDRMNWTNAGNKCGSAGNLSVAGYQSSTKLPTQAHLQAVASPGQGGKNGAAHAAGWVDDLYNVSLFMYWTGEAKSNGTSAGLVSLKNGATGSVSASFNRMVAVCLP